MEPEIARQSPQRILTHGFRNPCLETMDWSTRPPSRKQTKSLLFDSEFVPNPKEEGMSESRATLLSQHPPAPRSAAQKAIFIPLAWTTMSAR